MKDLEKNWDLLIARLEKQFDYDITLKGVLYLIKDINKIYFNKLIDRFEKIKFKNRNNPKKYF